MTSPRLFSFQSGSPGRFKNNISHDTFVLLSTKIIKDKLSIFQGIANFSKNQNCCPWPTLQSWKAKELSTNAATFFDKSVYHVSCIDMTMHTRSRYNKVRCILYVFIQLLKEYLHIMHEMKASRLPFLSCLLSLFINFASRYSVF